MLVLHSSDCSSSFLGLDLMARTMSIVAAARLLDWFLHFNLKALKYLRDTHGSVFEQLSKRGPPHSQMLSAMMSEYIWHIWSDIWDNLVCLMRKTNKRM